MADTMEVMRWLEANGFMTQKATNQLAKRYRESRPQPTPYREHHPDKQYAMVVDVDGTLAQMVTRGPYDTTRYLEDELHEFVAMLVHMYIKTYAELGIDLKVIVTTGRYEGHRSVTEEWLSRQGVIYDRLLMRHGAHVNDKEGDHRNDALVKRELFERHIDPHFNVVVALDDRNRVVEMWRHLGIPTLQVGPGDF
jgi:hypothetical protein